MSFRSRMQHIGKVLASSLLTHLAGAVPVTVEVQPGGQFEVDYSLSVLTDSLSSTVELSGDLTFDLGLGPAGIDSVRFTDGNVAYSDTTEDVTVSTFPPSRIEIQTRDIVARIFSTSSAGAIDPVTGILSNSGHRHDQDRGTIRSRYYVLGAVVQEDLRDLAQEPDRGPLVGETKVTMQLLEDLGYRARHEVILTHQRDETRTQSAPFVGATLTIREVGGFEARGELDLPGQAFVDWSLDRLAQRPRTLADRGAVGGQPLVLLFAFRAVGPMWQPPILFDHAARKIRIRPPAAGLRAPVRVEHSPNLAAGSWQPWMTAEEEPLILAIGDAEEVALDWPTAERAFLRLALAE